MKKHHPEQGNNEIYLGNCTEEDWKNGAIGWKTSRRGETPIYSNGTPMIGKDAASYKPVFVERSEVERVAQSRTDSFNRKSLQRLLDNGKADGL